MGKDTLKIERRQLLDCTGKRYNLFNIFRTHTKAPHTCIHLDVDPGGFTICARDERKLVGSFKTTKSNRKVEVCDVVHLPIWSLPQDMYWSLNTCVPEFSGLAHHGNS